MNATLSALMHSKARKSIDSLCVIIVEYFNDNPQCGSLYYILSTEACSRGASGRQALTGRSRQRLLPTNHCGATQLQDVMNIIVVASIFVRIDTDALRRFTKIATHFSHA
jgi:hypothetical protein